MLRTNCGDPSHNIKTCSKLKPAIDEDAAKRGQRDSLRIPAVSAQIGGISKMLSPKREVPVLPLGAQEATGSDSMHVPLAEETRRREPTNADIMARLDTIVTEW